MTNIRWWLPKYTHEIVAPGGIVVARLRVGAQFQLALDAGDGEPILYCSGPAFNAHVAHNMRHRLDAVFPADNIGGELHYFTGRDYSGCEIRRITAP